MTKLELIERFAESDVFNSKAEATRAFDHLVTVITETLKAGQDVALGQNFGTFKVTEQAGRKGTAPSGATFDTAPKNVVKFAPSAPLKRIVAGQ